MSDMAGRVGITTLEECLAVERSGSCRDTRLLIHHSPLPIIFERATHWDRPAVSDPHSDRASRATSLWNRG